MKVNLKAPILDYDEKEISIPNAEGVERSITYFEVVTTALNSQIQGEVLTSEKKNFIYQLSMKLHKQKEPNLTAEQSALIKERVGLAYGPLIMGRVGDLMDGVDQPKAEEKAADEQSPAN